MQGIAQPRTTLTRLGDIMQGLPLGIVVVDRRYDIQAINTAAHRLLGIHRAAIGEDLIHLVENLPAQALRAMIDAAFRGATPANMGDIVTVETVIGEQRYLHVECYPQSIAADDDSAEWVSVLVNDITENVHARLASDESYQAERRRLEERSAQQQDEIARFTTQIQRLAELNRELFEANEELTSANMELHSSNEEFLVSSEEVQAASEEVETLNEELQATNEELETLNEELQATVEELNTTNADLQARSLELQDLATSLEQQRQTVDAERSRLAAILVSMGDAVLVVDNDGNLALTNTAYERMFGVTSASFSAQDAEGHPLDVRSALLERVANGEAFSLEFTRIAPDGSRRWFEAKGQPADGVKDVRGVIIIRDITERSMRRLQDQFLALASHELRTPLTSIQGSLQLLEKALSGGKISERSIHYAQSAARQVKRLGRLVDDLVDVSRLNNGRLNLQLHPVNLAQIVRQTVETFEMERAQPKGPTPSVRIVGDTDPLMVNGDATRIEQILQNLLTNALKYAPTSESIDVQLRRVGREAELQVKDYGAGIPEVDVPHLFSRFYQVSRGDRASQSGLGLGLFIVKELVNAHGGSIAVTSEVGVGTTFTLRLPLLQEIEGSTGF